MSPEDEVSEGWFPVAFFAYNCGEQFCEGRSTVVARVRFELQPRDCLAGTLLMILISSWFQDEGMFLHIQKPETVNSLLLRPVVLVMLFIYGCCGETSAGLKVSYLCFDLIEDHRRPSPEPTPLQHPGYAFLQQLHQQEAIAEKLCQVLWENLLKVLSMLCLSIAL